ncbi:MAG: tRNA pseudouridine(55) synthase TruB [Chloroflexi bacterium]|nr:tRNA pseudouridine(55) synthase TruB [Chloroflexota bacterium]
MHGIFNVNKPRNITSHDVVNMVRRASGTRRVGHAGTLDPAAEGVLLICVGKATRVAEYLVDSRKTYCAEVALGIETDTYDSEGQIVARAPEERTRSIKLDDVKSALQSLTGKIAQVPPMYSAIKKQGKPLYKLARAGAHIELQPREVEIYRADVLDWQPPVVKIEIECSKGTYIRSFAHDLGQLLGCGAYLSYLVRLASGRFKIEDAVPLSALEDAIRGGYWQEMIYPLDHALLAFGAAILSAESEKAVANGQSWAPRVEPTSATIEEIHEFCRAYSLEGEIVALLKLDRHARCWRPEKVFV